MLRCTKSEPRRIFVHCYYGYLDNPSHFLKYDEIIGYENRSWRAFEIDLFTGASRGFECNTAGIMSDILLVILKELFAFLISGEALSEKSFDAA